MRGRENRVIGLLRKTNLFEPKNEDSGAVSGPLTMEDALTVRYPLRNAKIKLSHLLSRDG